MQLFQKLAEGENCPAVAQLFSDKRKAEDITTFSETGVHQNASFKSSWQTNKEEAESLLSKLKKLIPHGEHVYCFSLGMSMHFFLIGNDMF